MVLLLFAVHCNLYFHSQGHSLEFGYTFFRGRPVLHPGILYITHEKSLPGIPK